MNGDGVIFGYQFKNPALLDEALTTPSCKMENPSVKDNQRLEFLGDAVLGLLAADYLYAERRNLKEGALTVERTGMVSSAALCKAAARHSLAARLKRNRAAKELPCNSKTLADAIEAIIGAAWIDGGLDAAKVIFDSLDLTVQSEGDESIANPKGELQIRAQAMVPPRQPMYTLVSTLGKAHEPIFTVRVSVEGMGEAEATARTRKEAEVGAALNLLQAQDSL